MTTQDKLIRRKLSILELAEHLKNVSRACKINGVSRQHFFDVKKAFDENGIEGLKEKTRRKPCIRNRVAPEVEDAVVKWQLNIQPMARPVNSMNYVKSVSWRLGVAFEAFG